ncbi:MAG: hypothetical protein GF308_18255 [Candidatus Heimdallarchaeota archaeon]|nr:hypothetical protein [Candidatus Heimdallarchaeota archaeon]
MTTNSFGRIQLACWVLGVNAENKLVYPNAASGARKYLLMCPNIDSADFVHEIIETNRDYFNCNREFILLISKNTCQELTIDQRVQLESTLFLFGIENSSIIVWEESEELEELFQNLIIDMIEENRQFDTLQGSSVVNIKLTKKIARDMGFQINKNNEITQQLDNLFFRVNIKTGQIFVEPGFCRDCQKSCPVNKKLCIIVDDYGYSNIPDLVNLRLIAVLVAIRDGSIKKLEGVENYREDLEYQIEKIIEKCKNCEKIKTN